MGLWSFTWTFWLQESSNIAARVLTCYTSCTRIISKAIWTAKSLRALKKKKKYGVYLLRMEQRGISYQRPEGPFDAHYWSWETLTSVHKPGSPLSTCCNTQNSLTSTIQHSSQCVPRVITNMTHQAPTNLVTAVPVKFTGPQQDTCPSALPFIASHSDRILSSFTISC